MSKGPELVPAPSVAGQQSVVSREEKVEYRDQDGNLLSPEQVKALEGKVSFKTRYETRTRLIDANGNEISDGAVEGEVPVAPPHPDTEGADPQTAGSPEPDSKEGPNVQKEVAADESKEGNVGKSETEAKPASEVNEATGA